MVHTASDVANYVYCPKAWDLTRGETNEAARLAGIKEHERRNKELTQLRNAYSDAQRLGLAALAVLIAGLAAQMAWLAFPTLPRTFRYALLTTSAVCALGTLLLGTLYRRREHAANARAHKMGLSAGTVTSIDETIRYYASEERELIGIPDSIQHTSGGLVPVEIKSGSAPPHGPWENHRMQVTAYNLLIEDTTGSPPPYGLLVYADSRHRIPNDSAHREKLHHILQQMSAHLTQGHPVRRIHNNPAKCSGCAHQHRCGDRL